MYFDSISNMQGYLIETPKKKQVIDNAVIDGKVSILPNSNNRALIIENDKGTFLQSYDTLICCITKEGKLIKYYNDYTKTTLKHINDFLGKYGYNFTKKSWLEF